MNILWTDKRIHDEITLRVREQKSWAAAIKVATTIVGDYEARITELEAQLAAATRWEPVPDGVYAIDSWTLNVSCGGQELDQWHTNNTYKDGSPRYVQDITLGEYRLCRRAREANNE